MNLIIAESELLYGGTSGTLQLNNLRRVIK